MRIAFFVNSIEGETANYTTTELALAALNRGHDICYVTPGDFVLRPDDSLVVRALTLPSDKYKKAETLFKDLQGKETSIETIDGRRDRCAVAAQRSVRGRRRPALGRAGRHDLRAAGGRARRDGGQRSRRLGPGAEQALFPGFSRPRCGRRR